tara:strand:- start:117 stop:350 length:234 start_codon:yes stop_codon:yes gene_type:complete
VDRVAEAASLKAAAVEICLAKASLKVPVLAAVAAVAVLAEVLAEVAVLAAVLAAVAVYREEEAVLAMGLLKHLWIQI